MEKSESIKEKLQEPFSATDIEWRIGSAGETNGNKWATCLAYVSNRAIQNRLDDVFGVLYWHNEYKAGPLGGVMCGISIRSGDSWITKWDGADNTKIEPVKGGFSDSMKRAAVQLGIGRYLYNLDAGFAVISPSGKNKGKTKQGNFFNWNPPKLPAWALPANTKPEKEKTETTQTIEPKKETQKPDRSIAFTAIWTKKAVELKMPKGKIFHEMLKFIGKTLGTTVVDVKLLPDTAWSSLAVYLQNDPKKMEEYIHGVTFIENLDDPSGAPEIFITCKEYMDRLNGILKRLNDAGIPQKDADDVLIKGGYSAYPQNAMPNERKPVLELLEELAGQIDS